MVEKIIGEQTTFSEGLKTVVLTARLHQGLKGKAHSRRTGSPLR